MRDRNPNMSQDERRKASLQRFEQVEQEGISDAFYAKFSRCIQIKERLQEVEPPDPGLFDSTTR